MSDFIAKKITFLNFFLVVAALAVGLFFEWRTGELMRELTIDATHITWVIIVATAITIAQLGHLSWKLSTETIDEVDWRTEWAIWAPGALMILGIIGTTRGIFLGGGTGDAASLLGTAVLSTNFGAVGAFIVGLLTVNLFWGMAKIRHHTAKALIIAMSEHHNVDAVL